MAESQPTSLTLYRQHAHEYNCWRSMRKRCSTPENPSWRYYGAKGVTVCERWQLFPAFLEDIGLAPTPQHQIDRLDNEKGYCPENCLWSTPAEQAENTSKVLYLTCRDITLTIADWARLFGLAPGTIRGRIALGWTTEEAIMTTVEGKFRPKSGRTLPKKG